MATRLIAQLENKRARLDVDYDEALSMITAFRLQNNTSLAITVRAWTGTGRSREAIFPPNSQTTVLLPTTTGQRLTYRVREKGWEGLSMSTSH